VSDADSHAVHLAELAAAQRATARMLAAAVAEASDAGMPWKAIAEALGISKATAFRQHKAGSPVSVLRPFQTPRGGSA
jgi:DNA invertase Pin-like site-specific DNA recombinase